MPPAVQEQAGTFLIGLLGRQPQPQKELTRGEGNMQDTIEDAVDEGPRKNRQHDADKPLLAGTKFELDKGAEWHPHRKAKQPDRDEITQDPSKDTHGATIDDIDRYLRPCLFCKIAAGPLPLSSHVHYQLTDGERQHREPNHPRKEARPEIESQALHHGKNKYNHNKETKHCFPAESPDRCASRTDTIRRG